MINFFLHRPCQTFMMTASNSSDAILLTGPASSSVIDFVLDCLQSTVGLVSLTVLIVISILILPVHVLVLKLALQKWQQKQSTTAISNFDLITYHLVVLELVSVVGSIFGFIGLLIGYINLTVVGVYLSPLKLTGHMLFDILTCAERYLAVVHPVTYLSLRTANGIRARNVIIGCVWVMSAVSVGTMSLIDEVSLVLLSSATVCLCVLFISFCSISALCVLTQTKPGEGVAERQVFDRSKLKAFYTIIFILAMLLLRSGSSLLTLIKLDSVQMRTNVKCGLWFSVFWFCLPSSLVSPLLLLQKAGKLTFCTKKQ